MYLILFALSFLAFLLSAICGGGAGLLLMPVLGMFLPVYEVPAALSIGTFSSSFSRIIAFRKNISWYIVKRFVPIAIPAAWLGVWLLKFINPVYLQVFIGVFLVSNIPFLLKKDKEIAQTEKSSGFVLLMIGFFTGFLSGLTGAVGLVFNKFYLRYGLSKEEIVATRAANEVLLHLIKIILYSFFGLLSKDGIIFGLLIALSAVLSTLSVRWVLRSMSEIVFKKTGYFAMVFSGFFMLFQAVPLFFALHQLDFNTKAKGWETKWLWQENNLSLEFAYSEGFEIERVIPLSDLSMEKQKFVLSHKQDADDVRIEVVYKFRSVSYEAYYFKQGVLSHKIDF
jgi:uncharacterized membrane protein YfcA